MEKEVASEAAVLPSDLNEASVPTDLSITIEVSSPDLEANKSSKSDDNMSRIALSKLPLKKQLSKQFGEYSTTQEHQLDKNDSDENMETADRENVRKRLNSSSQCNPTLPDDIDIDTKKMRGDAIGSTLYSERWVIKLLMKLSKWNEITWNKEIEDELCCLWDMTLEPDVIIFLMQNNILEIISTILLQQQKEFRAVEIFLGIVGNLCSSTEVRHKILMKTDFLRLLLKLLELPDTLALIQLMRPLKACIAEFRYFFEMRCLPSGSKSNSDCEGVKSAEVAQKALSLQSQSRPLKDLLSLPGNLPEFIIQNKNGEMAEINPLERSVLPVMRLLVSTALWHPHIVFILNSSRNGQLLKDTLELLDDLLGVLLNPDSMSPQLCTPQMVGALIETLSELQGSIDRETSEHTSKPHEIIVHWVSIIAYCSGSFEGCSVLAERDFEITYVLCRYISPDLLVDSIHPDSITLIKNATEIIVHILPEWHFNMDIFCIFVSILTVLKQKERQALKAIAENSVQPSNEYDEIQTLLDDLMWPVEYVCMTMVDDTMNDDKDANKSHLISAIQKLSSLELMCLGDVLNKHSIDMPDSNME